MVESADLDGWPHGGVREDDVQPLDGQFREQPLRLVLPADHLDRLRQALEAGGATFIAENGGGVGVRLKFSRSDVRRIATLEGEGGTVAMDDVP